MKTLHALAVLLVLAPTVFSRSHRPALSEAIVRGRAYEPVIYQAAARYSVDPRLIWIIAYLESRFRPELVSPKGARGMMQFIPATGRRYGLLTVRDLHDPVR